MTRKPAKKAPKHLKPQTAAWFDAVCHEYTLEPHHIRILTLAAEAWDRGQQAREAIDWHGLTFNDRFGVPKARPEIAIERDSRIAFARLIRELGLDIEQPEDPRPPRIGGSLH